MSAKTAADHGVKAYRFFDFFVILLLLSFAVYSINRFRLDLFQSLDARNEDSIGTIIVKNNIVQRRFSDRVIWDRLFASSPVYSGDLIRVAELSSATLELGENRIDLNENTLIRIQRSSDGDAPFQIELIELNEGGLSLAAGEDVIVNVAGRQLQALTGTVLTVQAGEDGTEVRVIEGNAEFTVDGLAREIVPGGMLALDAVGDELTEKAAVVITPGPNARYLKSAPEPIPVVFSWNRVYLENNDTLLLQAARDRNFTQSVRSVGNLYDRTQAAFDAGQWYWRLSLEDKTLGEGRFTVVEAAGPALISPVADSLIRYQSDLPDMFFQWSEIEDASFYLVEVCDTQDFANPQISREFTASSFVYPNMEPGTWHWRVRPVFSELYDGVSAYSSNASFRIEQSGDTLLSALELPEPQPASVAAAVEEAAPLPPPPPPQPLPAPTNRLPTEGYRIGINELRTQQSITFSWSDVTGANAYIFALYQQTANGRRLILRREPENITRWIMTDLSDLDERGTFVWQVEAVSRNRAGTIERRGRTGENRFTLDIPPTAQIQADETGRLYGN